MSDSQSATASQSVDQTDIAQELDPAGHLLVELNGDLVRVKPGDALAPFVDAAVAESPLAQVGDQVAQDAKSAAQSAVEAKQNIDDAVAAVVPVFEPIEAAGGVTLAFQSLLSTTYDVTLKANSTITIADGAAAAKALRMEVRIIPNGFLATVVFQGSGVWSGGGAPIFSMSQSSRFFLTTTDGGATCYGSPN